AALTNIMWINDGGTLNVGWRKTTGVDWSASYDFDAGDFGAWNVGIVGTYYLGNETQTLPGTPITDSYHSTVASGGVNESDGVPTGIRMRYRGRLGWSNGPWSLTGFVNYESHFFYAQSAPPNVNGQCSSPGGVSGGGTFPCAIQGYTNIVPSYYT